MTRSGLRGPGQVNGKRQTRGSFHLRRQLMRMPTLNAEMGMQIAGSED